MNNFKNNHRRNRFKSNGDRNFRKRNGNGHKVNGEFNNPEFKRRNPGKNNQNASKLIEKYTTLAKEALSNGDKILSESYYQHADHFLRVIENKNLTRNNTKPHLESSSSEENSNDKIILKDEQNSSSKQSQNNEEI